MHASRVGNVAARACPFPPDFNVLHAALSCTPAVSRVAARHSNKHAAWTSSYEPFLRRQPVTRCVVKNASMKSMLRANGDCCRGKRAEQQEPPGTLEFLFETADAAAAGARTTAGVPALGVMTIIERMHTLGASAWETDDVRAHNVARLADKHH
ncbi:hypothetical protein EON62_01700 [archaeon]|nr:MAG: hypothetical protein EON62_01700 [archaeon]